MSELQAITAPIHETIREVEQKLSEQQQRRSRIDSSVTTSLGLAFLLSVAPFAYSHLPNPVRLVSAVAGMGFAVQAKKQREHSEMSTFKQGGLEAQYQTLSVRAVEAVAQVQQAVTESKTAQILSQMTQQQQRPLTEVELWLQSIVTTINTYGKPKPQGMPSEVAAAMGGGGGKSNPATSMVVAYLGEPESTDFGYRIPLARPNGVAISAVENAVKNCRKELETDCNIPIVTFQGVDYPCVVSGLGGMFLVVVQPESLPMLTPSAPVKDLEFAIPAAGAPVEKRVVAEVVNANEADRAQLLVSMFAQFGVNVQHDGIIEGARIVRHKIKPAPGVKVRTIQALASDLQIALGLKSTPIISVQAGYIAVDVPTEQTTLMFSDYIKPEQRPNSSDVMVAIGVDVFGKLVEGNLSDPDYCHGLGGGMTGSGKTELIMAQILSLTSRYTPELVKYCIHTMKQQDFVQPFFQFNPWAWKPTTRTPLDALKTVQDLLIEMRGRNKFLAGHGSKNIDEHNRKFPDAPLHHIVFQFDECCGTLLALKMMDAENAEAAKDPESGSSGSRYHAEMTEALKALAKESRASGIHLYLWDQKPSEKGLDTDIRSELGLRLCLRVVAPQASKMVIDGTEAVSLLGKGDMLLSQGGVLQRLQGLYVNPELLEKQFSVEGGQPAVESAEIAEFDKEFEEKHGIDPDDVIGVSLDKAPQGLRTAAFGVTKP